MRGKVNTEKIDTWISKEMLIALECYMAVERRGKADAIREGLRKLLVLEGHLKGMNESEKSNCSHEYIIGYDSEDNAHVACQNCGFRP